MNKMYPDNINLINYPCWIIRYKYGKDTIEISSHRLIGFAKLELDIDYIVPCYFDYEVQSLKYADDDEYSCAIVYNDPCDMTPQQIKDVVLTSRAGFEPHCIDYSEIQLKNGN